ncbi:hypothetical protein C8Q80DRAFT_392079 [Daedaleopsis nitida]|nr:hypothetical protein C8Q80DRAFT_392079 [Daedaleopsis nitida]
MSYTHQRTTESWNNDPNRFSNTQGPDAGFHDGFGKQPGEPGSFFPGDLRDSRPTQDPTDTSTWGMAPTGRRERPRERERDDFNTGGGAQRAAQPGGGATDTLWTAGRGENYGATGIGGNTTDVNTFGAGGNAFEGSGGARGGSNWDSSHSTAAGGKSSMTEKLKGNVEKMAERVSGRH